MCVYVHLSIFVPTLAHDGLVRIDSSQSQSRTDSTWQPQVMEKTFRPPYYHRNLMSEFMGMVYGK